MKAAQQQKEEKTGLTISKWIKGAPEKIFDALTNPEKMAKWFTPDITVMRPKAQADARKGGRYRLEMNRLQDGEYCKAGSHLVTGTYLEVVPSSRLVFSWGWVNDDNAFPEESVVTITLTAKDGGTELTLTHERLPSEEYVNRHMQGWEGCLASLAAFIAG